MKKTLIIGASDNPERYSYKAADKLLSHGHEIELLGLKPVEVFGRKVNVDRLNYVDLHTVTLYVGPQNQPSYYDYVVGLKPQRVIFNPGTENEDFEQILIQNNIQFEVACTLVLLATGQY